MTNYLYTLLALGATWGTPQMRLDQTAPPTHVPYVVQTQPWNNNQIIHPVQPYFYYPIINQPSYFTYYPYRCWFGQ